MQYQGRDKKNRASRTRILERIEETSALLVQTSALRSKLLDDPDGDTLDSVIAAFATFQALRNLARSSVPETDPYELEGFDNLYANSLQLKVSIAES